MLIFQTFYGNVMPEISKLYCFLEKNALANCDTENIM